MKQNGVFCYSGPALLFLLFRFEYLFSGPESYLDLRETGDMAGDQPGGLFQKRCR